MGVLQNVKGFLAKKVVETAEKIGDGVANLSVLSPKQLQNIENKRDEYLSQKHDMNSKETEYFIKKNIGAVAVEVYQAYLEQLKNVYSPLYTNMENFDEDNRIRYFDITKWVTDSEENSLDKLINVYHVLSDEDCNIALIYHRTKDECRVIIGVVNTDEENSDPSVINKYYSRIVGAIKGNFPGSGIQEINSKYEGYGVGIPECLSDLEDKKNKSESKSIAVVSNIASEKSEKFISQSMEKLIDGIIPKDNSQEYTIVLLAKPKKDYLESKNRLFELYTSLSPYTSWQTGFNYVESYGHNSNFNLGLNLGGGFGKTSNGDKTSDVYSNNAFVNFGTSFCRTSSVTVNIGKNESLTQTYTNFGIKHTQEVIENQIKRIEESSALGMWEFASYVISDDPVIANNVAHMYLALTQGEDSYISKATVNLWYGDLEPVPTRNILSSVQKLQHPIFGLKALNDDWLMYPTLVTATTPLSGKELAKALNFPRKSVSGLPVLDIVSFGREPHSLLNDNTLDIDFGCGYHMHKKVPEQRIFISKEELTKHTFITGSTGSGKSNTIYRLLEKLTESKVNFLVVEPAKGEYKDVIGKREGVVTYGTNPNLVNIDLLRINPFRFPKSIHILEHLDRLVEIFNVCWPMYAAMPAILKDSVERAYISVGWNLEKSTNKYDNNIFPNFDDVVKQIRIVLNESDYSDDNKGDYIGSLVTRLNSLTNGINGLIFTSNDISDEELFDRNVIVDLSRVGSTETKSLIMGLLVLKLQEYRMEQRENGANSDDKLKHVTILEEAHNLLRRISTEQTSEGSNLLGKSVEMLANSIAEMRTYGEGFIIADQSPGLLDMSVIRNTNTKIILRLPDFSDRELVGKASGLTDNQIIELAKLEKGVAVISQSDWIEPVLCKIDKYEVNIGILENFSVKKKDSKKVVSTKEIEKSILECIMNKELYRIGDKIDIKNLRNEVLNSGMSASFICKYIDYISLDNESVVDGLGAMVYEFFNSEKAISSAKREIEVEKWVNRVVDELYPSVKTYNQEQIDLLIGLILNQKAFNDVTYNDMLIRYTEIFMRRRSAY